MLGIQVFKIIQMSPAPRGSIDRKVSAILIIANEGHRHQNDNHKEETAQDHEVILLGITASPNKSQCTIHHRYGETHGRTHTHIYIK